MENLWTSVQVRNMDESVKFYSEILGLPLSKRYSPMPGMEIAFLGEGKTKLELFYREGAKVMHSPCVSTGFRVESLDETMATLKENNIEIVEGPYSPAPNISFLFVEEPSGYRIQLVEMKSV